MPTRLTLSGYKFKDVGAYIDMEIWDRNKKHLTLINLDVSTKLQGRGLGHQLFLKIIKYMQKKKINKLYFTNANRGFWNVLTKKYPKNIELIGESHGIIKRRKMI